RLLHHRGDGRADVERTEARKFGGFQAAGIETDSAELQEESGGKRRLDCRNRRRGDRHSHSLVAAMCAIPAIKSWRPGALAPPKWCPSWPPLTRPRYRAGIGGWA